MKIEWNKITWYSWILTGIVFLILFPLLTFYFVSLYENNNIPITNQARNQAEINNLNSTDITTSTYIQRAGDEILASSDNYSIILRTEDQSGIAYLTQQKGQSIAILASDEDIIPQVEKLVPKEIALKLAVQFTRREVEKNGGQAKFQIKINEYVKKHGNNFYNYLSPLSIQAYKANGVVIPHEK
ncbi:MAG: hypothetical protein WCG97_03745 [bacterium]